MACPPGSEQNLPDSYSVKGNAELFDEIAALLKRSDRTHVEVILLIGTSGSGKSALINTIHKVLTGQYYQIAKHGSGASSSVTRALTRYNNCGISLETISNEDHRNQIEKVLPGLPHIVDCAGFGDENSPKLQEILELILGGYIHPGTQVETLLATQSEKGVGMLKRMYSTANPAWKVTKVVFMHSCRCVNIPTKLINCLNEVLQIVDPVTYKRKYNAEVFLLITKYDLVHDAGVHISETRDEKCVTMEEFVNVEKAIAPHLDIEGALEANRIRWASFTDKILGDNAYIEKTALTFLKRMIEPGPPVQESTPPVLDLKKRFELYMEDALVNLHRYLNNGLQRNISLHDSLKALIVLFVVLACLYCLNTVLLKPP